MCIACIVSYSVVNMELPVAVSSKLEHRAVICYLTARGESANAIYRQLAEVYGDAVTYDVVKRWRHSFFEGRTSLADDERSTLRNWTKNSSLTEFQN